MELTEELSKSIDVEQYPPKPTPLALDVRRVSATRLFPESRSTSSHSVPLSILDATVARYGPTSAAWLYDKPIEDRGRAALSMTQLKLSLQKTMNFYPQWAGQLEYVAYKPNSGNHTQRFGRLILSYGKTSDPGVEFAIAHSPHSLSSLIPSTEDRQAGLGCWDAGQVTLSELFPTSPSVALKSEQEGAPCLIVQLTTFDCGGIAIATRVAHPLADAQALVQFVKNWEIVNSAMMSGSYVPAISPVFDPSLLDKAAAGDIDAIKPDPELIDVSRALPIDRFDWWASGEPRPSALGDEDVEPLGTSMPWSDWDREAPVDHHIVYFTPEEIVRIWIDASSSGVRVSRHDALPAHVWSLIIRNRELETNEETVVNVTLGVRQRLSPPLPESFLGSPIIMIRATGMKSSSISALATSIRAAQNQFTPDSISAHLHDKAYETSPQRLWGAFSGRKHSIITSWLRLGIYEINFGGCEHPRYVDGVLPSTDGFVQFMEAGPMVKAKSAGQWYDGIVGVSLYLRADAMKKVLEDPTLRAYRD